jgi:hypothetical protein
MKVCNVAVCLCVCLGSAVAQPLKCDFGGYKPANGVSAVQNKDVVVVTWTGEANQELRAGFTLRNGQPVVTELAARELSGNWVVLGKDLSPEFEVTTGKRRD